MNKKKLLISSISAMVLIAVVVLLLALRSCGRADTDPAASSGYGSERITDNTRADGQEKTAKADIAGHYEIVAMISDGKESSAEDLALMKSRGLSCTIVLNADGTGVLDLFGEESVLTWDAEAITAAGKTMPYMCRYGLLTLINGNSSLTFSRTEQP